MNESRKMERWDLVRFLRVYEDDTGVLFGHLADINPEGMKLMSAGPIPEQRDYKIKIKVLSDHIRLSVRCLWSRKDDAADLYQSGFKVLETSSETQKGIACLIEALKYRKDEGNT